MLLSISPLLLTAQHTNDTLPKRKLSVQDQLYGFEERITEAENQLFKLTRIHLSGYIQAQWQHFENPAVYPNNYFSIPRARFKIKYQPYSGVSFVLEPDFTPSKVSIKAAYACLNDPWINTFALYAGHIKRLNYENELSSSALAVLTRSMVVSALYPGEYDIGAKFEVNPPQLPFHLQLALFNGNESLVITNAEGDNINPANKDFDPYKDLMGRFVYNFRLGNIGGIDVGVSGYYGWIKANSTTLLHSDYTFARELSVGNSVPRRWMGVEMQLYLDLLGGISVIGEYLFGTNAYPGYMGSSTITAPSAVELINDTMFITNSVTNTSVVTPAISRNFMGAYIYFIKNIGKKNKFAIRWEFYDPNTALTANRIGIASFDESTHNTVTETTVTGHDPVVSESDIHQTNDVNTLKSGVADIAYQNISMAWSYYVTEHITLQAAYDIPLNQKVGTNAAGQGNVIRSYTVNDNTVVNDYSRVFPQNILTIRMQVKF